MTIWLVFPSNKLNAMSNAYGNAGVQDGEVISSPQLNAAGAKYFTGSSRITAGQSDNLKLGNAPWLEVHDTPAFFDTWDFPPDD